MLCELCGNREAGFKMVLEGSELRVCEGCKGERAIKIEVKKPVLKEFKAKKTEELDLMPDFGERIRKGRKEVEIGKGDLAHKLGIKESLLARIEKGELEPEDFLVSKIEKELKIGLRGKIDYKMTPHIDKKPTTFGDIVELK